MKNTWLRFCFLSALLCIISASSFAASYRYIPAPQPLKLPYFSWFDANDGYMDMRKLKGQVVLLNLWATWCAPCVIEMPDLDRLQKKYEKAGLHVAPVAIGQRPEKLVPFYQQHQLRNLAIYYDSFKTIHKKMGARLVPTTFLINRKGELVGTFEGPAKWLNSKVKRIIEAELKKGLGNTYMPPTRKGIIDAN